MAKPNLLTGTFITYSENNLPNPKGKKFAEKEITFTLADDKTVTGKGRLITPRACYQMVKQKFDDTIRSSKNIQKDFTGYLVGKEAILQILAQQDCEGIMILDCVNDEDSPSLVILGVDKYEQLLKIDKFSLDDQTITETDKPADIPIVIERIGKINTKEVLGLMEGNEALKDKSEDEKATVLTNTFLGIK